MTTELTFSTIDKIPNTKLRFIQLIKCEVSCEVSSGSPFLLY